MRSKIGQGYLKRRHLIIVSTQALAGQTLRYNVESSALLVSTLMVTISSLHSRLIKRSVVVAALVSGIYVQVISPTIQIDYFDSSATLSYVRRLTTDLSQLPPDAIILDGPMLEAVMGN